MELLTPNVALSGEATQSSSFKHDKFNDPDDAHYAIDGNFSTDVLWSGARCAITNWETGPWWQVDLKYEFEITKVAITTRKYCKLLYFGIPDISVGVTLVVKVFQENRFPETLHIRFVRVFLVFFFKFLLDTYPFVGPLIPLFWTSGDISSGFQSQSGLCLIPTWQRRMCNTFPEIHLWCDTFAGV